MADVNNVAKVKYYSDAGFPTCYLQIDGLAGIFAIMQYSDSFAKNEIPQATVTLGTGKQVNKSLFTQLGGGLLYRDPSSLNELKGGGLKKAQVFLDMGGNDWAPGDDRKWDSGHKCIFEGYYAGVGYTRSKSTVQVTVSLVHRLIDLTFSSLYSRWTHPSNGASFSSPANLGLSCSPAGAGEKGKPNSDIGGVVKSKFREEDDFGKSIIESLKCLADSDLFDGQCKEFAAISDEESPNTAAKEVLDNIESKVGEYNQPLNAQAFRDSIAISIGKSIDSNLGNTYWDFLVNKVCAAYLTSVIPFPSKDTSPGGNYAYVVPNMPGYKEPGKTLYLNDYNQFQQKSQLWKPLYAVVVNNNISDISGANPGFGDTSPNCTGGIWPKPDVTAENKNSTGQLLITSAPVFLKDLPSVANAPAIKNVGDTSVAVNDPFGGTAAPADDTQKPAAEAAAEFNDILGLYARTLYVSNAINGRLGSFTTKLRYDIAPGTILKLERGPENPFDTSSYMRLPVTNVAQVSRVSNNINAESGIASTTFEVVHVRTEEENKDESGMYSTDEHPFFGGKYNYESLVEDWAFEESENE